MGRKPTPNNLKVLAGTYRKDRDVSAPDFDVIEEFPDPPNTLDVEGQKMWRHMCEQLILTRVLQVVDIYALEQLCYTWQRFRRNATAGNDWTAAENNMLTKQFSEFGITPASRRKIASGDAKKTANKFANNG